MYFYIISSVLWLISATLLSDEPQEAAAPPSLVNMTGMPSSVVGGVNVITGDFIEYDEEYLISGPDPYTIGHTYVSSSLKEGSLGDGWNFLHDHLLEVYQPAGIKYVSRDGGSEELVFKPLLPPEIGPGLWVPRDFDNHHSHDWSNSGNPAPRINSKYVFAHLDEACGGRLTFEGNYNYHKLKDFKVKTKGTGFTNVCGGKISGQTNIKNIRLHWNRDNDSWNVTTGDGTKREYCRAWKLSEMKQEKKDRKYAKKHRDYHLVKETKPSGNYTEFAYNDDHELTWMRLYNKDGQKLSHVHFQQQGNNTLPVTNSDLQEFSYTFKSLKGLDHKNKKLNDTFGVSGIKRPGLPAIRFLYDKKSSNHIRRLEKKEYDDGNFVEIKYYRPHTNEMGDRKPKKLKSKQAKRFNKNRVRYLKAPVGQDHASVLTHSFEYYRGYADVFDAYNARTRYYWNKDKRLTKIERFNNRSKLEMAEKFVWGKGKNDGHLIMQTIFDSDYTPKYVRKFTYDKRGNILQEMLQGRFCSSTSDDTLTTKYTYSNDGFNLKTSECDPEGNYTYYSYVKGTNLLKAKFMCDKKKICRREFYSYDNSAIMTQKIVDDGASRQKDDLAGVTERHTTKITPRKVAPHFGEAEIIEEYAFDTLLKRTVNTFSDKGFVVERRVYGSDEKLGAITKFNYDDVGRITYMQDPCGSVERYSYNTSGLLEKKEMPSSTILYKYDLAGRLCYEEERIPEQPALKRYCTHDKLGRKVEEIDPQNNHTQYEYDVLNHLTKITYPTINDAITPTKSYEYKKLGTIRIATDENDYKTTTLYNAAGKVLEEHFPDGTTRFCEYDKKGNLIKEILPNGTQQTMTYDGFGRVTSCTTLDGTTTRTYNAFHLLKEVSPTGEVERFEYDIAGRKIKSSLNKERVSSYSYDTLGRLEEERTSSYSKKYHYDALDRVIRESAYDTTGKLESYQLFGYDDDGNQNVVEIPVNGTLAKTKTAFMAHSLPKEHIDALGNSWHYEHDLVAQKKRTTDPRGVTQEELFDAHGNLSHVTIFSPFGTLLAKKEFSYDGVGNCTCTLEHSIVNGESVKVIKTLCKYGPNNRLEEIVEAADTPEAKTTTYRYNKLGQKECTIHADGTELYTLYDEKGRVKQFYAKDKSLDYSYRYDASDKICEVTNNLTGNKTIRTYNTLGELESETLESGLTLRYDYDNAGRVNKLTLPDASSIAYNFSTYLKSVSRISSDNNELWQHTILERDLCGKAVSMKLPHQAGIVKSHHDVLLRTVKLEHPGFTQEAITFDAVGNLTEMITDKVTSRFSYDFLSQLTHEEGFADHTYACDSLYDRLKLDDKEYQVNSLHSVLSDSARHFEYDERGNRKSDGTFTYTYDALDRLIEVNAPGKRYVYSYDAFDRRIAKTAYLNDEIKQTRYLYALENEIGAVDEQGAITELRILGEGIGAEIGASVGIELHNKLYVPLHDLRGNVAALLNPHTAAVQESYRYDAFGNELQEPSQLENPWRFSSKRVDEETGLVYFGRRYYDPSLGKWLTMDPLGLKAGPNLYAYVLNNPMTHFDLYGLLEEHATEQHDSHERSIWADVWGGVKSWCDSFCSSSMDAVRESLKEDMRSDIFFNILEHAANKSTSPATFNVQIFLNPSPLNMMYEEIDEVDLGQIVSDACREWFVNAMTDWVIGRKGSSINRIVPSNGPKLPSKNLPSLDKLSKAGHVPDRGGLTKAGRALDKHGARPKSAFPKAKGTPLERNAQGQHELDDILTHPQSSTTQWRHRSFGDVIDVQAPNRGGARFNQNGDFIGFLEP